MVVKPAGSGRRGAFSAPVSHASDKGPFSMNDQVYQMFRLIRSLAASPVVRECLNLAKSCRSELVAEIARICEIPAPTFHEEARAAYLERRLAEAGLEGVHRDRVGNVIGRRRGRHGEPSIILAAHLDTVFPAETEITVRRTADALYGPGIGDNSSSLGALIWVARILDMAGVKLERDIVFCATVGEEGLGDLRGMKEIMASMGDRVACVIPLDGSLGGLVHEAVGSRRFRLRVTAGGGHSWGAFGAPSAIHSLGRIIARISELQVPRDPKTTYNVGVISGGTSVNTIAASAECLLDLRSVDREELEKLEKRVMAIVDQVSADTAVDTSSELLGDRPAGTISADHPLCLMVRAIHQYLGIVTKTYPSSTDANVPLSMGIPSVSIGVTTGANGHRVDEYIFTDPLDKGMQQVILLLLALQKTLATGGAPWRQ